MLLERVFKLNFTKFILTEHITTCALNKHKTIDAVRNSNVKFIPKPHVVSNKNNKIINTAQLWQRYRASLGDFKRMGHFEAKFYVEGLLFAPMTVRLGNGYVKQQRLTSKHYIRPTYLLALAACTHHVNNHGPRPQSKVLNLRISKSNFILQTIRKYY